MLTKVSIPQTGRPLFSHRNQHWRLVGQPVFQSLKREGRYLAVYASDIPEIDNEFQSLKREGRYLAYDVQMRRRVHNEVFQSLKREGRYLAVPHVLDAWCNGCVFQSLKREGRYLARATRTPTPPTPVSFNPSNGKAAI